MTTPEQDALSQQNAALVRDFMDLATALGVEPSFAAVSQRVADLLTLERRMQRPGRLPDHES